MTWININFLKKRSIANFKEDIRGENRKDFSQAKEKLNQPGRRQEKGKGSHSIKQNRKRRGLLVSECNPKELA